jgi:hypothetical protein
MYKSRLSQWKFTKNSSDREYQICAVLHKIRKDKGKSRTAFIINGNQRSVKDLRKYVKGRKMSDEEFLAYSLSNINESQLHEEANVRAITPQPDTEGDTGNLKEDSDRDESDIPGPTGTLEVGLAPQVGLGHTAGHGPTARAERTVSIPSSHPQTHFNFPDLQFAKPDPDNLLPSTTSNHGYLPSDSSLNNNVPHQLSTASPAAYHHVRPQLPLTPDLFDAQVSPRTYSQHPPFSHANSTAGYTSSPIESNGRLRSGSSAYQTPHSRPTLNTAQSLPGNGSRHTSPRASFGRSDVDALAYSTLYSQSLQQTHGTDNLDAWVMMNPDASDTSSMSDYEQICPRCRSTSEHFSTACNYSSPDSIMLHSPDSHSDVLPDLSPRDIFNPDPNLPPHDAHFAIPASTKQTDHSWRWISHCFSACIFYSRDRYTDSSDHNLTEYTPRAALAPKDFAIARMDLDCANAEFKAMLLCNDPNILLALNQTVTVLMMHNWNNITPHIMQGAADTAEAVVGKDHPIWILTRLMVLMTNSTTMYEQREITSATLKAVWQAFVNGWKSEITGHSIEAEGDAGRRAIPAMYSYASLLMIEATRPGLDDSSRSIKMAECEYTLMSCHQLARDAFSRKHLQAIQALVKLQLCLDRQGRVEEAIKYTEMAVNDGEESLGKWHPRHLETKRILAELYRRCGKDDETINIYWYVLEGRVRMLGRKHESTMLIKGTLIEFLKERGRWTDDPHDKCPDRDRFNDLWEWQDVKREDGGDGSPAEHTREGY